jgi:ABC-type oligopeptide transport system substrate-binding subunit
VANSGDGTLSEIDAHSDHVAQPVWIGGSPVALATLAGRLWVSVQVLAAAITAADAGRFGGVARVAFKDDPGSPDPALALVDGNAQILDATCAKLYNYPDTSGTAASRIIPEIALGRPTVSEHGLRYTTTVQRGFRFSPPSNAHVTAQTFRDVIERVFSPRWRAPTIEAVDARDIVGLGAYQQRHVPTSRDSGRPAIV